MQPLVNASTLLEDKVENKKTMINSTVHQELQSKEHEINNLREQIEQLRN